MSFAWNMEESAWTQWSCKLYGTTSIFVPIWWQMPSSHWVFFMKKYFLRNWNVFLNVYWRYTSIVVSLIFLFKKILWDGRWVRNETLEVFFNLLWISWGKDTIWMSMCKSGGLCLRNACLSILEGLDVQIGK
jgi:Tol biopolymer transport system component